MQNAAQHVDVDDSASISGDSGYSEIVCSTESLRSSVYDYEKQHGRTYHAFHQGKYLLPNDEGEQERMDIHYHCFRLAIGDVLFLAPLEKPSGILDIGTGTGIWAIDCADMWPEADVVGIDLSPIQPRWVPPNLQFEVLDADLAWGFRAERFSLVHSRIMNGFGVASWPHFYQEAFQCLQPGDSKMVEWAKLFNKAVGMIGKSQLCYPHKMAEQMEAAGFINTKITMYKMPIGPWAKDQNLKQSGLYGLAALYDGVFGMSVKLFVDVMGWSKDEFEVFLASFRDELRKKSIHSYWPAYVVIGQKPLKAEG